LKKMERLKTFDRDQYAIEFEDDWLAEFGNEGEIQLQVVFCSETVELKIVGEESLKDLNEIEINNRFSENSQIHHWKGLLASPPISVDLADLSSLPLVQRETVPNNEEKRN